MVPSDRLQTVLNDCVAARLTQPGFISVRSGNDSVRPPPDGPEQLRGGKGAGGDSTGVLFVKSWFDLAGTPVFQCSGMYIRRLWLRRENEGVHRDCYSKEGMRGLKRVLGK